jgi:hypothetical protein
MKYEKKVRVHHRKDHTFAYQSPGSAGLCLIERRSAYITSEPGDESRNHLINVLGLHRVVLSVSSVNNWLDWTC